MLEELTGSGGAAEDLVRMLRILSDPTRLRLLALLERGERNVSSLCDAMEVAQPTVSHHLAMLRSVKLVETRRDGKQVFYSLNPSRVTQDGARSLSFSSGHVELKLSTMEAAPVVTTPHEDLVSAGAMPRIETDAAGAANPLRT